MAQLQRLVIAPSQLQDKKIVLTTQQQHYLSRVLRLQAGDRFIAMDGSGQSWLAVVTQAGVQIVEQILVQTELPVSITLMLALPKGNAFDDVVRQCTELGVAAIVPVLSDRTLLNPSPQKLERWRRIAKEAAEQSERAFVPSISDPVPFTDSLATVTATYRYFCVTRRNCPHLKSVLNSVSPASEILIAIGSEGGWTENEVDRAIASKFQPVSLGNRILRAVTAPIVALSLASATFEG